MTLGWAVIAMGAFALVFMLPMSAMIARGSRSLAIPPMSTFGALLLRGFVIILGVVALAIGIILLVSGPV